MQHQIDHDNFYDYFPQLSYAERSIPCNPAQDYHLRELYPEKSKMVLPISHAFIPPVHLTTLTNGSDLHTEHSLPHHSISQGIQSKIQPTMQSLIHQDHQVQSVIASDPSKIPSPIDCNNHSYETDSGELSKNNSASKKKRTRLRYMINPEEWVRNKNKKARMLGLAYKGWIKTNDGKYILAAERKALECGPPCDCKRSKKGKELQCCKLMENERRAIFDKTCSMSWEAKKVWVQSHVEALEPKKKAQTDRHRSMSIAYYLPTCSGKRMRVCRHMFLSTLGRNRRQVESWIKEGRLSLPGNLGKEDDVSPRSNDEIGMIVRKPCLTIEEKIDKFTNFLKPGEESKKLLRKKACLEKRKKACEFFDSLGKTSLHNFLYLDSNYKTGAALYKMYRQSVGDSMTVSTFVFFQEMKTKRIKLLKPKKYSSNYKSHSRQD